MRLPVSISAEAMMVRLPPSSVLRAAENSWRGFSRARMSSPPVMVRPLPLRAAL